MEQELGFCVKHGDVSPEALAVLANTPPRRSVPALYYRPLQTEDARRGEAIGRGEFDLQQREGQIVTLIRRLAAFHVHTL